MFEDLPSIPLPTKITIKDSEGDTRVPYERIKSYDDKEFELFIREWVTTLSNKYQVRGFGGAGDKGRDVIAQDDKGNYYYYQCKHYSAPLTPSDMMPELGKLVYYTFSKEIPVPKEYYIMAPYDIGPTLNDLISKPTQINQEIINNWTTKCNFKSKPISMTQRLKKYITAFDFSIIKTKTMLEVVNEHKQTAFYAFRFGGGLTVKRDYSSINVPNSIESLESNYVSKYLEAISEVEKVSIESTDQLKERFPRWWEDLKIQRERFFSAENLKLFVKEQLLDPAYFDDLFQDIYYGIHDYFVKEYSFGIERLQDVMNNVVQMQLQHNLLVKYDLVRPRDRQGVCHQIANEKKEISWIWKEAQ